MLPIENRVHGYVNSGNNVQPPDILPSNIVSHDRNSLAAESNTQQGSECESNLVDGSRNIEYKTPKVTKWYKVRQLVQVKL